MKIKRIEHVGVAVRNLEASRNLRENVLGIRLDAVEHAPGTEGCLIEPAGLPKTPAHA